MKTIYLYKINTTYNTKFAVLANNAQEALDLAEKVLKHITTYDEKIVSIEEINNELDIYSADD